MANGKKNGVSMAFINKQITDFKSNCEKMEANLNNFFANPPLVVETAFATVNNGVHGAAFSLFMDMIAARIFSVLPVPPPLKANLMTLHEDRFISARNMGVLLGADAGITCVIKRIRGKEDIQTRMVAGFGAGVLFMTIGRNPPATVIAAGVFFALVNAALFEVREKRKKLLE